MVLTYAFGHMRGVSRARVVSTDASAPGPPVYMTTTLNIPTITPPITTATTVAAVCPAELYLSRRATAASRATARSALNAAARALGESHYGAVDWALDYPRAALIRSAINVLDPGWSKVIWSTVRQVAAEARRLRLCDADTLAAIFELPGPGGSGGHRGRTPSDDDVAALLEQAAADPTLRGRRDAAVIAVLAGCGLRRAEAAALRVDHLDTTARTLLVRSAKGRRQRLLPVPDWSWLLLEDWLSSSGPTATLLVGVDRWGAAADALSGHALNDIVSRLAHSAGIEPLTCHGLRRYAITGLLRVGVGDVGLAQRMAGHAQISTTIKSYDARGFDDLEQAVRRRPTPARTSTPVVAANQP
jgi:integrase/recombinase XerD